MLTEEQVESMRATGRSQKVALELLTERFRQISDEGWTSEHDDEHGAGELAKAATCYALCAGTGLAVQSGVDTYHEFPDEYQAAKHPGTIWPWSPDWWKPKNPRRDLVRAGALIIAEIERLDRVEKGQATDG